MKFICDVNVLLIACRYTTYKFYGETKVILLADILGL